MAVPKVYNTSTGQWEPVMTDPSSFPASNVSFSDSGLAVVSGNDVQAALAATDAALADRMTTQQVEDYVEAETTWRKLPPVSGGGGLTVPDIPAAARLLKVEMVGRLDSAGRVTCRVNNDNTADLHRSSGYSVTEAGAVSDTFGPGNFTVWSLGWWSTVYSCNLVATIRTGAETGVRTSYQADASYQTLSGGALRSFSQGRLQSVVSSVTSLQFFGSGGSLADTIIDVSYLL